MIVLFLLLLLYTIDSVSAEYCYQSGFTRYYRVHCTFGCCGPSYDQYCCSSSGGVIAGIVFGGIAAVAGLAAIICCCIKQASHRGQIIRPAPTGTTYVGTQTTQSNIFMVPAGTPYGTYPGGYNHVYPPPGQPHPYPDSALSPGYPQPTVPHPPPYSQVGSPGLPPAYSQPSANFVPAQPIDENQHKPLFPSSPSEKT